MTDPDSSYRPRSPDFSTFQSFSNHFNTTNNNKNNNNHNPNAFQPQPPYLASPHGQRASYDASPFFNSGYQPPVVTNSRVPQQYIQQPLPLDYNYDMARRSSRLSAAGAQPAGVAPQPIMFDPSVYSAPPGPAEEMRKPKPWDGIEVKTKFPVARIKRIMQADEEVGKVAQVTPIAVSKALELFMISLVTKAAQEARDRNSKRVTAAHLKQAVSKDEVLDFLADICSKVPDHTTKKTDEDGSDHNESKRKSGGGRRKKEPDSDYL